MVIVKNPFLEYRAYQSVPNSTIAILSIVPEINRYVLMKMALTAGLLARVCWRPLHVCPSLDVLDRLYRAFRVLGQVFDLPAFFKAKSPGTRLGVGANGQLGRRVFAKNCRWDESVRASGVTIRSRSGDIDESEIAANQGWLRLSGDSLTKN